MTAVIVNHFLPKGKIKRIHVNQHLIRKQDPKPLTVQQSGRPSTTAAELEICDEEGNVVAVVHYRPEKPLSCGARVWIETTNEVRIR